MNTTPEQLAEQQCAQAFNQRLNNRIALEHGQTCIANYSMSEQIVQLQARLADQIERNHALTAANTDLHARLAAYTSGEQSTLTRHRKKKA